MIADYPFGAMNCRFSPLTSSSFPLRGFEPSILGQFITPEFSKQED